MEYFMLKIACNSFTTLLILYHVVLKVWNCFKLLNLNQHFLHIALTAQKFDYYDVSKMIASSVPCSRARVLSEVACLPLIPNQDRRVVVLDLVVHIFDIKKWMGACY